MVGNWLRLFKQISYGDKELYWVSKIKCILANIDKFLPLRSFLLNSQRQFFYFFIPCSMLNYTRKYLKKTSYLLQLILCTGTRLRWATKAPLRPTPAQPTALQATTVPKPRPTSSPTHPRPRPPTLTGATIPRRRTDRLTVIIPPPTPTGRQRCHRRRIRPVNTPTPSPSRPVIMGMPMGRTSRPIRRTKATTSQRRHRQYWQANHLLRRPLRLGRRFHRRCHLKRRHRRPRISLSGW